MRHGHVHEGRGRVTARDGDHPVRLIAQQEVVASVAVPVERQQCPGPGPGRSLQVQPRTFDDAAARAYPDGVRRGVRVGDVGAAVVVEVEHDGTARQGIEELHAIRRRGDARQRGVFVHQQFFGTIAVEVDALAGPAEEIAALGIRVAVHVELRVERDRRPESAAGSSEGGADAQRVHLRVGILGPGDVAEAVAVQVRAPDVAHVGGQRDARVHGCAEAGRSAARDGKARARRGQEKVAAAVAIGVERHADAPGRRNPGIHDRAERAVRKAQAVADRGRSGGGAAGPDIVVSPVAVEIGQVPGLARGEVAVPRRLSRETRRQDRSRACRRSSRSASRTGNPSRPHRIPAASRAGCARRWTAPVRT